MLHVFNHCDSIFIFFSSANNPKGLLEVREALEKVHKVEDLLPIMKVN